MKPVIYFPWVYQYVLFCHAWPLKQRACHSRYSVDSHVHEAIALLVESFLTG